jgi:NodT family efflux transporter outer membrane factor (OMF) lipoprotein
LVGVFATVLCAGCVGTGDAPPPATPIAPARLGLTAAGDAIAWPQQHWWRVFGDPQLDRLIDAANAGSPSLQIATARVRLAQQAASQLGAVTDPEVDLNGNLNRQRYSENYIYQPPLSGGIYTDARVALDFSYEFDFWGGQRAALAAANKQVEAEQAERASAQLILAVAVARSYFSLQYSYAELALDRASVEQRAALAELYELRAARGLSSRREVEPHTAALATARQNLAIGERDIAVLKHQLAALTGQGPEALADLAAPHASATDLPAALPAALPVDLLGRRPDIIALRLRAAAAGGDIAAAKAEFYPNIDLTAFFGFQSLGTDDLLRGGSRTYGVGPALHLPLFNRRALRANLGARYADYDLAVAQYNQAVLDAAREVADQGAALRALERQRQAVDTSLAALQRAYDSSRLRRSRGLTNQLEVLEAQTALLAQQRVQAQLRASELQTQLALIKALGGGYGATAAAARNAQGE